MKTEKFTVTLPSDLKQKIKELADREQRNVSNMTMVLLTKALTENCKQGANR
jgi:predicted transcriptional regulator